MSLVVATPWLVACGLGTAGLGIVGTDAGTGDAVDASPLDATAGKADAGVDAALADTGASVAATAEAGDAADASDPGADAGPCQGVRCNGACLADAGDCRGCPGNPLLCGATQACGATCDDCAAQPIACFNCDSKRQNPVGTCQPFEADSYCINGDDYPDDHCGCALKNDPTQCPGATQVCGEIAIFTVGCMTCGESGSDGLACRGGGVCHESTATCQ